MKKKIAYMDKKALFLIVSVIKFLSKSKNASRDDCLYKYI